MNTTVLKRPIDLGRASLASQLLQVCKDFADLEAWERNDIKPGYNENIVMSFQHEGLDIEFSCEILLKPAVIDHTRCVPDDDELHVYDIRIIYIGVIEEVCHA